jgi:hypothetical protein
MSCSLKLLAKKGGLLLVRVIQQPQDGVCLHEGKTPNLSIEEQENLSKKMGIAQGACRSNNQGRNLKDTGKMRSFTRR